MDPSSSPSQNLSLNQALALHQAGDLSGAISGYRAVLDADPSNGEAYHLMGVALKDAGQPDAGLRFIEHALSLGISGFSIENNRALCLLTVGDHEAAIPALEALASDPTLEPVQGLQVTLNLALARLTGGERTGVLEAIRTLTRHPKLFPLGYDSGPLKAQSNLLKRAVSGEARLLLTRAAVALHPANLDLALEDAEANLDFIKIEDAAARYMRITRVGLKTEQDGATKVLSQAWANSLFLLNFLPQTTNQTLYTAARDWASSLPTGSHAPAVIKSRSNSKLRVGYLSQDFRTHHFLAEILPILKNHDRAEIECLAIADVLEADAGTQKVEATADQFLNLGGLPLLQKQQALKELGCDVIVGLTGYRADQRDLLLEKAAPIQLIAINHVATTGLLTVDGHITDPWLDPVQADRPATEALHRLDSGYGIYNPPLDAPAISERTPGPIVFGSFNNLLKVTDETLRLWALLLNEVPNSTLLIKAMALARFDVRRQTQARAVAAGIDPDRLILIGATVDRSAHLSALSQADVALDPIPFAGGATSREALWMGLPLVTLAGKTWASRIGASLLGRLGMTEQITTSESDYLTAAVRLAEDPDRLATLRGTLRSQIKASPLTDAETHTRELEALYRRLRTGA